MRLVVLFMLAACSSASPVTQLPAKGHRPTLAPRAEGTVDASVTRPLPGHRGDACSAERVCGAGLACTALSGGYCAGACELGCADGSCVETPRHGELCMKRCASDRECRVDEGYVCDPLWQACLLPNLTAIVPRACPLAPKEPARDTSFAASERWSWTTPGGDYQVDPAAVVTDDGGLVAIYSSRTGMLDAHPLGLSRIDGKGASTMETMPHAGAGHHASPSLARDRKGILFAAWLSSEGERGRARVVLATSSDRGVVWGVPVAVEDPLDCAETAFDCLDAPLVVVGPDPVNRARDIVYVLYAAKGAGLRVRASRDGGATFGAATTALVGNLGAAEVGTDGKLHVVMLDGSPLGAYGSAHHKVEYSVSRDGGATFARPVRVSGHEERLPYHFARPALAVDTRRKLLYAAYVRGGRDAKWEIVLAVSKDGGTSWKRTKLAGDGCAIHMLPSLALDPTTGKLHASYIDSVTSVAAPTTAGAADNTTAVPAVGRLVHASCTIGAAKCARHGAINTVPFATLSTVRHSRRWIGEHTSLVIDAKRRGLHAVWAQVVDDGGASAVSRIFHSRAKLK